MWPCMQARAFGLHNKLFDLLDEESLIPTQIRQTCQVWTIDDWLMLDD